MSWDLGSSTKRTITPLTKTPKAVPGLTDKYRDPPNIKCLPYQENEIYKTRIENLVKKTTTEAGRIASLAEKQNQRDFRMEKEKLLAEIKQTQKKTPGADKWLNKDDSLHHHKVGEACDQFRREYRGSIGTNVNLTRERICGTRRDSWLAASTSKPSASTQYQRGPRRQSEIPKGSARPEDGYQVLSTAGGSLLPAIYSTHGMDINQPNYSGNDLVKHFFDLTLSKESEENH